MERRFFLSTSGRLAALTFGAGLIKSAKAESNESTTAAVASFAHLPICVSDIDRSAKFYCDAFGFEMGPSNLITDSRVGRLLQVGDGIRLRTQFVRLGVLNLELMQFLSPVDGSGRSNRKMNQLGLAALSFRVRNLSETLGKIEALGGAILKDTRAEMRPNAVLIFATDPDGVRLEIAGA